MNYYNENDPKAAAWLRELIRSGLIPDGIVDERSIADVKPSDLAGFTQCHFFAGIGGWSHAFFLAGIPHARRLWTGSCPCQPFSDAGLGLGTADTRHLWPVWFKLILECQPPEIYGEQVASKAALDWLDGVFLDLEGADYACAAADLCSAGVGAPHIRQRLYWVAYAGHESAGRCADAGETESGRPLGDFAGRGVARGLADSVCERRRCGQSRDEDAGDAGFAGQTLWDNFAIVHCTDGKTRRFEPGSFPLAHGVSGRVGLLRGYGNGINPYLAALFIRATEEVRAQHIAR